MRPRFYARGAASGGFHPQAQLANAGVLKAWWNADDVATGAVASWTDRIASIALAQGTGANQPVKAATTFMGFGGVTFDGTNDVLDAASVNAALPSGTAAGEIWALCQDDSVDTNARNVFKYGDGTTNGARGVLSILSGTYTRFGIGSGTNTPLTDRRPSSGASVRGAIFLAGGTTVTGRKDGESTIPGFSSSSSWNTATTRTRMGANTAATAASFWLGVIRHVIVTSELTDAQRLRLEGWLAWDGNIPGKLPPNHPYRYARP